MSYCSYEKLEVWQKAIDLSVQIYKALRNCKDYGLKDQVCRASVSVASNIAEGMERDSRKETIRFLHISKGSCAEVRTQLLIANKVGYIEEQKFAELNGIAESISRMLHGLVKAVQERE